MNDKPKKPTKKLRQAKKLAKTKPLAVNAYIQIDGVPAPTPQG